LASNCFRYIYAFAMNWLYLNRVKSTLLARTQL
jgi:hypothetical protein